MSTTAQDLPDNATQQETKEFIDKALAEMRESEGPAEVPGEGQDPAHFLWLYTQG